MNYRRIGNTTISVSEIAFGAWGIGGITKDARAYGHTDDNISQLALQKAYDLGVNFYDTAPLYGYGHSEKLIGNTLSHLRHRIILSSKVGYLDFKGNQDFSVKHIRKSLGKSLLRLKTDYLDVFQLHDPPIEKLYRESHIFETMQALKDEGQIRAIGISTRSPCEDIIAIEKFEIDAIQLNFSLVDQRIIENGVLEKCQIKNVGVFVRTPLCFGFLSGNYASTNKFSSGDHRNRWNSEQIERWANAYKLFTSNLPETDNQTNAQVALRFCLSYPQVATVIPGMLTPEHVEENIKSSKLGGLPLEFLQTFSRIYQEHQFFIQN